MTRTERPVWLGRLCLLTILLAVPRLTAADLTAADLRCDRLRDPVGVDLTTAPRFSWAVRSAEPDQRQAAYQLVVDGAWDSGRVESDRTLFVPYAGRPLTPATGYTWRVRAWDAHGRPGAWSEPATFVTATGAYTGHWIGRDERDPRDLRGARWVWFAEGQPARSAPPGTRYFRRSFDLPAGSVRGGATCVVTADNAFEMRVNGQAAGHGDDFTRPAVIDVGPPLRDGPNTLEVAAINVGDAPSPAGLVAKLRAGAVTVVTDGGWEASVDRVTWTPAMVLGPYGMGPWGRPEAGPLPARYLRREFAVDRPLRRATASVCGLGFFDLSVNGRPASDHVMDPAVSDYRKAVYAVAFDVTGQLHPGANAVGVVLGNGRFYPPRTQVPARVVPFGFPKLLFQLDLEYADGTRSAVVSDDRWRLTSGGPIRSDNEYDGEAYDARLEMDGWDRPGFDDRRWEPAAAVDAPAGAVVPQMMEPMRVTQRLRPVSVTNPAPGTYVFDLGQNFYGTAELHAAAPRGTVVRMTEAYAALPDGTLKTADNRSALATDQYTFKGVGTETWSPRFRGQGFRRVQVTGLASPPTVDTIQGLVIHTDCPPVGDFACSNDQVNRLHSALRWGSRMFLRSAPLDPDRDERQAWGGDPAKDAESEAYNFDVSSFYAKYMDDVQRSQRPDGSLPDVAMYWTGGDGVEWPSVFTIVPDWMADFYADPAVAAAHYPAMKRWVLAMRRHERPDGTLAATSFGDWCDTATIGGHVTDFGATPRDLISSAYQYHNYRILQRLARDGGRADDAAAFAKLGDDLRAAFNAKFLGADHYAGDTQCGQVLPLAFGLVPGDRRAAVAAWLAGDVMVRHDRHLTVGLVGMQWLMQTLTDEGRPDVAWALATQTTRPSWGYMLARGATTIWERWDYDTRDPGMNSEALLIQAGNLDAWFYQTLAGIRPAAAGFKRVLIRPSVVGDLTWVTAHFDSPCGRIESRWRLDRGVLAMDVTVPANTTATVVVPGRDGSTHDVGSGHHHFESHGPF